MNTSHYTCPISDCDWTYQVPELTDTPPAEGFDDAALEAARAQFAAQAEQIETACREHYESHGAEDWLREVMGLRAAVAARMLCAGCITDSRVCEMLGKPQMPIYPAVTVINGVAICDVEGRHRIVAPKPGGLVLPGQQLPPGMMN